MGAGISLLANGNATESICFGSVQRLNFFCGDGPIKEGHHEDKDRKAPYHIEIALAGDACSRASYYY